MDTPAIRTDGRSKRSGSLLAVDGLDLSVERGEVFGFLGPNGAGKSTVIRLLLDLIRPNAGRAVDTRFFDNPQARIEARHVGAAGASKGAAAHGAGLEVRITFKNAKDVHEGSLKSQQEPDGYYYVYLTFPAGSDAAAAPTTAEPEK